MFGRLAERGRRRADERAAARRAELAARLREAAPGGVQASVEGEDVVLSGRGLARRMIEEPALRWLVAEARDGR